MKRTLAAVGLLLAAVTLAGCHATTDAGIDPAAAASYSASLATVSPTGVAEAAVKPLASNNVVIIGDSWTSGYGATNSRTDNWGTVAAQTLGWNLTEVYASGAGYAQVGEYTNEDYAALVAKAAPPQPPALVVVQGGINDVKKLAQLPTAVPKIVAALRAKWPQAQLLMLGPISPNASSNPSLAKVDYQLAMQARDLSVPYIDAFSWITPLNQAQYIEQTKRHPNTVGYAYMAQRFVEAFNAQLARSTGDPSPSPSSSG